MCIKGADVGIVCSKIISEIIKTHYETMHASQVSGRDGQLRRNEITQLPNDLAQYQGLFKSLTLKSNTAVCASYLVSEILTKKYVTFY
jgi:hypothetical protein